MAIESVISAVNTELPPRGEGLRGPFFICQGFDVTMGRCVDGSIFTVL
jgi:hypothetical protein